MKEVELSSNHSQDDGEDEDKKYKKHLLKEETIFKGAPIEKEFILVPVSPTSDIQDADSPAKQPEFEKVPFKTLVIRKKRDRIMKFLKREDSFSKELQ